MTRLLLFAQFFLFAQLALAPVALPEPAGPVPAIDRETISSALTTADVPGVAIARIVEGDLQFETLGSASPHTDIALTPDTIFEAASLSKTVFATMFLEAVTSGQLALDEPLATTRASRRVTDTSMYAALTPRLILSHQSGLPNWSGDSRDPARTDPLEFKRKPGAGFGYSGEGYELLRAHVEARLETTLQSWFEAYQDQFGMPHSQYAYASTAPGSAIAKGVSAETTRGISLSPLGLAAASLTTSARDYGHFIRYLLENRALFENLTDGQVVVEEDDRGNLSWGLGWGLYKRADGSRVAFHWGDNWQFKAFVAINIDTSVGVVYFANGVGGLKLIAPIVEPVVGELVMVRDWLGYEDDK